MSDVEETLHKWYEAKKKLENIEEKINKYKIKITKEMNRRDVDTLKEGKYSVSRRRNTRTSLSKENVPEAIWKEYSTRISYDSFHLQQI